MRHRLLLNALCLQQLEDVKATQIDNCSYRVGSMPSPFILWLIDITFIIFRWCYNGRHNFVNKIYIFWIREKVRYRKIVFRPVNSWLPCHQTKIYHWHDWRQLTLFIWGCATWRTLVWVSPSLICSALSPSHQSRFYLNNSFS